MYLFPAALDLVGILHCRHSGRGWGRSEASQPPLSIHSPAALNREVDSNAEQ